MNVGIGEIESLSGQKADPKPKETKKKPLSQEQRKKTAVLVRTSNNTLDIRGQRVDNAEIEINNAIAKAIEAGVLWIIHGKGTGRLRQGVHEYLQRHPQVEKFELASQKEGGAGVTLVYLK
jgi:DNA mismatch repair protein MutS2